MLEYYRFKQIADLFAQGQTEEARLQLAEMQKIYVELSDENLSYRLQLQEYEDVLYLARNLYFDKRFYWLVTGSVKQGPFCPKCYQRDGLLMRLSGVPEERRCPYCQEHYFDDGGEMALAVSQDHGYQDIAEELSSKGNILPFKKK